MQRLVPTTSEPQKSLIEILKKHSGRDNRGTISVRHQGGRHKRYYRIIDFRRDKKDIEGKVISVEYDPNRNTRIALIEYKDGEKRYILQPKDLTVGMTVKSGEQAEVKVGNALPLKNIPLGVSVHNVQLYPEARGSIVRSAGGAAVVVAKEDPYIHLKLPSGEVRKFLGNCWATIGVLGNEGHKEEIIGNAGRKRRMGIRPTVRGTAQNPRSHPHGGGEGRSGEGMHSKTPWGKAARGKRTRHPKKWSKKLIVKRRK